MKYSGFNPNCFICSPPTVPPPKLYLQLNPVQITFDPLSILWLNSFGRSLQRAVLTDPPPPPSYLDVHLEAVMPKVRMSSEQVRNV